MQMMTVQLVDDLDGSNAEETVAFALDGAEYEIDLNAENSERLRDLLNEYIEHARRVGGRTSPRKRTTTAATAPADQVTARDIRRWLDSEGRGDELSPMGRVPSRYYEEYAARVAA
jgi:hypothetical protein